MNHSRMALAQFANAKASNDDEFASTFRTGHDDAREESADRSAVGWDPFEVWRTRIKLALAFEPRDDRGAVRRKPSRRNRPN